MPNSEIVFIVSRHSYIEISFFKQKVSGPYRRNGPYIRNQIKASREYTVNLLYSLYSVVLYCIVLIPRMYEHVI